MMDDTGPILSTAEHVDFLEKRLAEQEEKIKHLKDCILVLKDRASGLTTDDVGVLALLSRI